jgi:hypothetical protein
MGVRIGPFVVAPSIFSVFGHNHPQKLFTINLSNTSEGSIQKFQTACIGFEGRIGRPEKDEEALKSDSGYVCLPFHVFHVLAYSYRGQGTLAAGDQKVNKWALGLCITEAHTLSARIPPPESALVPSEPLTLTRVSWSDEEAPEPDNGHEVLTCFYNRDRAQHS